MSSSYNYYVENKLPGDLSSLYSRPLEKRKFRVDKVVVIQPSIEPTKAIETEATYSYILEFHYYNHLNEALMMKIEVPKQVNNVFIINGKYKTPTLRLTNDHEIRLSSGLLRFDFYRSYDSSTDNIKFLDEDGIERVVNINQIEELPEIFNSLSNHQRKKLKVKLDLPSEPEIITKELLIHFKDNYSDINDKEEDALIDKKILTVQGGLVKELYAKRSEIYSRIAGDTIRKSKIYPSAINKIINRFFSLGGNMIDNPSKINPLTFSSQSTRIKMDKFMTYNRSLVDIIDPIKTPENKNTGILNELNVCAVINEDGGISIKCFDKEFNPIVVPYLDYYDSYIVDNQHVNYVTKKFIDENHIKLRYRGQLLEKDYTKDTLPKNFLIDAKADDKLSISTRNVPLVNHIDSIRVAMGSNMANQAVDLLDPDVPMVSSGNFSDATVHPLNVYAMTEGEVEEVESDKIIVKQKDGKKVTYHSNFVHSMYDLNVGVDSVVKKGDKLNTGDLLFKPKNIDDKGFKLGKNCRIAFMLHGNNYEDGVIVGSHIVDKFTHISIKDLDYVIRPYSQVSEILPIGEHVKEDDFVIKANDRLSSSDIDFISDSLSISSKNKFAGINVDHGLIVPKDFGEGIIADMRIVKGNIDVDPDTQAAIERFEKEYKTKRSAMMMKPENKKLLPYMKASMSTPDKLEIDYKYIVRVRLLQFNKLKVGNKITNRYGSKGLCSEIIPEDKMPRTEDGELIDMILNADSTVGRKIVTQLLELGLTNLSKAMFKHYDKIKLKNDKDFDKMRKEISDIIDPNVEIYTNQQLLDYHEDSRLRGYYQVVTGNFAKNTTQKLQKYAKLYKVSLDGEHLYTKEGRLYTEGKILVGDMFMMKLQQLPEKGAKVTGDMMRGARPVLGAHYRASGQSISEMETWGYSANDLNELLKHHYTRTETSDASKLLMEILRLGLDPDITYKTKDTGGYVTDRDDEGEGY